MAGSLASPRDDRARAERRPQSVEARQSIAVHEQPLRAWVHREHRASHRQKSRMQNVERIDLGRIRPANAERQCAAPNLPAQTRRARRAQHLGIRQTGDGPAAAQNDRGGDHRARQGSPPRLIDTRDHARSWRRHRQPGSPQQGKDRLRGAGAGVTFQIDV